MAHRVLLYTLDGATDVAEAYLASRGLADEFVLVGLAHRPMASPTAAELSGFEAVLGEFMPVSAAEADVMSSAGVRLVASMSIGLNHVDVAALAKRGVLTTNCPGYCADEVAECLVDDPLDEVCGDLRRCVGFRRCAGRGSRWCARLRVRWGRRCG